jgi:ATP-dependent helicase HrpB
MADKNTLFPVDAIIQELRTALNTAGRAILIAPPGAGKTTRVPQALLGDPLFGSGRILMLEPRRLAARRAAEHMASLAGEDAGQSIGYRIRGESRVSPATRIEIVTEGILTRMLQDQPELPGVGLLIFDEFHERSIHADLGLALTLDARTHLRPDLRILIMSATLDGVALASLLDNAPVIRSEGRMFPIETVHRTHPVEGMMEKAVVETVKRALQETAGDILVFLPGRRELHRCRNLLTDAHLPEDIHVHLLHGEASRADQDAALLPGKSNVRKIICATSIAETSLTIDGVRVVIDSGLARVPRFDPRRGMSGLVTVPASIATADQRRGRAGRQSPGMCYRLWTEAEEERREKFPVPEILSADLAPLALDLARWGAPDGTGLRFLDPLPAPHLHQAVALLKQLGALDETGRLTPHGKAMSEFPVHPRLAHMIIRAAELGMTETACDIAALLEGPELSRGSATSDVDLDGLLAMAEGNGRFDAASRSRILADARRLRKLAGARSDTKVQARPGVLLALAFPDRIARRRDEEGRRYLLANTTGAFLPEWSQLARHEFLAVGDVDGAGLEARIFLASPLTRDEIEVHCASSITTKDELFWDDPLGSVVCRRIRQLGALTINEQAVTPAGETAGEMMLEGIIRRGIACLPWKGETESVRTRSEWLRLNGLTGPEWPDLSDKHLRETASEWLLPHLSGLTRLEHLERLDLSGILRMLLGEKNRRVIDTLAPAYLQSPVGRKVLLEYGNATQPVMSVKLQDMFGQKENPTVAGGKVKVLLHLLSPARRPLAVTSDLASFWANAYTEVRKQMRSRYPKHPWPERPL